MGAHRKPLAMGAGTRNVDDPHRSHSDVGIQQPASVYLHEAGVQQADLVHLSTSHPRQVRHQSIALVI